MQDLIPEFNFRGWWAVYDNEDGTADLLEVLGYRNGSLVLRNVRTHRVEIESHYGNYGFFEPDLRASAEADCARIVSEYQDDGDPPFAESDAP